MSKTQKSSGARFDPLAPLVNPETGLEYEDFAAKLLGRPRETRRNEAIQRFREAGNEKGAVEAFWRGYDRCGETLDHKKHDEWLRQGGRPSLAAAAFRIATHHERCAAGYIDANLWRGADPDDAGA